MQTFSETVAILNELVSEKPDGYTYTDDPKTAERRMEMGASSGVMNTTDCYYAHSDGSPGCIVGAYIHRLNPEFDLGSIENVTVARALRSADISADQNTVRLLSDVQNLQDCGETWALAVGKAVGMHPVSISL